jgi:hypothetical protein
LVAGGPAEFVFLFTSYITRVEDFSKVFQKKFRSLVSGALRLSPAAGEDVICAPCSTVPGIFRG